MRKWIAAMLAASMLAPVAVEAQRGERRGDPDMDVRGPRGDRGQRPDMGPRPDAGRRPVGDDRPGGRIGDRDATDRNWADRNWADRGRGVVRAPDTPVRHPDAGPPRGDRRDGWRSDRAGRDPRGDDGGRGDNRRIWTSDRNDARRDEWNRDNRGWDNRIDNDRGWNDRGRDDRDREGRGWEGRRDWDRGWRGQSRFDWTRYRAANRDAFRLPRYYAPGGWTGGYRRFGIGIGLAPGLWGRNYWIGDPYAYRLPEVWGPYRWVRYYDDALLVDQRSGIVVDAVYGIFW